MTPNEALDLADYRRSVAEIYTAARAARSGSSAHREWTARRDVLFGSHAQSPIPQPERSQFPGLAYWAYAPEYRVSGALEAVDPAVLDIPHSAHGATRFLRVGRVQFDLSGSRHTLDVFWLDAYGGGLFVPFRDRTNGHETYGGGRYLLDAVKGADLGTEDGRLILDFNFAYHPSCVYSPLWSCPLAPPGNQIQMRVTAGERLTKS